jgi:large subunit ribosomal protein L4
MASAKFIDLSGKPGDLDLPGEIFDVQVNVPVMHEVVRAQLAAARAGTHSTKTRGDVAGGGAKPWRQKGLGRARHGSIREPQWRGGGIAHGPHPRNHSIRVNRKTRTLALRSALTDRAREGRVFVVDLPEFDEPRTRRAVELLEEWGVEGRVLLVVGIDDSADMSALLSFRNLPEVELAAYPTAYTVLACDTVIFTKPAFDSFTGPASARRGDSQDLPSGESSQAETAPETQEPAITSSPEVEDSVSPAPDSEAGE